MRYLPCKLLLACAALLFGLPALVAETRGVKRVEIKTSAGETVGLYEESHALVIGVSDYTNGWPKLPGVRKDVKAVTAALESHGFNVEVVVDAKDYDALDDAFTGFIRRHGRKPENRLLFYFAGHGHTVKNYGEEMGYIIPTTSPNPNRDLNGFLDSAMDMQQVEVYAKRIRSKHALFLFDSCFSGSLFALSRAVPENISYKTAKPVRQFITSGSADEQVPDTSIFRQQFVAALRGEGDTDGDRYITAIELGEFLQKTVVNYSRNAQHPQYGKIRNPNLDKGDFVFVLPMPTPQPEPSVISKEEPQPEKQLDVEAWAMVEDSDDPENFRFFIEQFPDSPRVKLARLKLKLLERKPEHVKEAEPKPKTVTESPPVATATVEETSDASLAGTPIPLTPKQEPQPKKTPKLVKEAEPEPVKEAELEPVKETEPEPPPTVEVPDEAPSETVVASERDMTWHYVTLGIAGVALLQSLSNANQFNALASKNQELANSYASSPSAATKSEYQSNQSKMKSYKSQVQLWDTITLLALGVEAYLWFSESPDTMASRFSPRVLAFSSPQAPRGFNLKWQWQF